MYPNIFRIHLGNRHFGKVDCPVDEIVAKSSERWMRTRTATRQGQRASGAFDGDEIELKTGTIQLLHIHTFGAMIMIMLTVTVKCNCTNVTSMNVSG